MGSSLITGKVSSEASAGWVPFRISGCYSHGSTDKKSNSSFDGRSISNKGLQIIVWVNTIVPNYSPE